MREKEGLTDRDNRVSSTRNYRDGPDHSRGTGFDPSYVEDGDGDGNLTMDYTGKTYEERRESQLFVFF